MNYYELVSSSSFGRMAKWQQDQASWDVSCQLNGFSTCIFTWQHQRKRGEAYFKPLIAVRRIGQN